jgi:hypothetical protein
MQSLLGARPQIPRVGIVEVWTAHSLLRSRTNAFASFLEKKKVAYPRGLLSSTCSIVASSCTGKNKTAGKKDHKTNRCDLFFLKKGPKTLALRGFNE